MQLTDLRSDTVTWPTALMREAMAKAAVGDDVYGDDPTTNKLETLAAEMTGKEAALLVPSGTFGNQLALMTWCPRGSEVILGEQCHIIQHEAGAASVLAGVQTRTVDAQDGYIKAQAVKSRIRGQDIHFPPTSLICMENAHSSGRVVSLSAMDEVREVAVDHGIPIHLDGARLFNAATCLGVPASHIAVRADSVMFCLSKGLCAPVGSMLAGPAAFIARARKNRKIMGGGMRQTGILAAAGLIALELMTKRLGEDHEHARYLASRLAVIPGIQLEAQPDINMVFFRIEKSIDADALTGFLREKGILVNGPDAGQWRVVTHYWIDRKRIDEFTASLEEFLSGSESGHA